jgi:hypothetical protein
MSGLRSTCRLARGRRLGRSLRASTRSGRLLQVEGKRYRPRIIGVIRKSTFMSDSRAGRPLKAHENRLELDRIAVGEQRGRTDSEAIEAVRLPDPERAFERRSAISRSACCRPPPAAFDSNKKQRAG